MSKLYGNEITGDALTITGNYSVTLKSVGNPDHGQDPDSAVYGVESKVQRVGSLAEASLACKVFIADNELGGGNWAGGDVCQDGKLVARTSYSGRVWAVPEATK